MDLDDSLSELESHLELPDFRDLAKGFEEHLRESRGLRREQREAIWQRYQALWDRRKAFSERRKQVSDAATARYMDQLLGLDFTYDGLPIFQTFSNFERVGEKIRATREILKGITNAVKNDSSLVAADRKKVFAAIDDVWRKVGLSEEATFSVHGERAAELYNEAYRAVESLAPHDATPIFKAAQADLKSLWLPKVEREKYFDWFGSLWATLQAKREEGKQRYENWRSRQEQGLLRLEAALAKAEGALDRVRGNNRQNHDRLGDARSDDWREVVSGWIQEGEEKERDIENSILELREKIRDARSRLQQ